MRIRIEELIEVSAVPLKIGKRCLAEIEADMLPISIGDSFWHAGNGSRERYVALEIRMAFDIATSSVFAIMDVATPKTMRKLKIDPSGVRALLGDSETPTWQSDNRA